MDSASFLKVSVQGSQPMLVEGLGVESGLCSRVGCVTTDRLDQHEMVLILFWGLSLTGGDFFKTCFPLDALISAVRSGWLYHCSSWYPVAKVAKQTNYKSKENLPCGIPSDWRNAVLWRCIPKLCMQSMALSLYINKPFC